METTGAKMRAVVAVAASLLAVFSIAQGAVQKQGTAPKLVEPSHSAPKAPIKDASVLQQAFVSVAEKVGPAVVSVNASYTMVQRFSSPQGDEFFDEFFRKFFEMPQPYERRQDVTSLGSGFIVTTDGYILTNAHVLGQAKDVMVTLTNKKQYRAKIIGKDDGSDVAVLKIKADEKLVAAPLGDSDAIEVGQWAIAIGNPFALENTVTVGVVSAKGRQLDTRVSGPSGRYTSFIQTDASINRGNSGGPLLNINGEVIGINTLIFSPSGGSVGIGFAIPISMAKRIMEEIIREGRYVRPQMGVMYRALDPEVAKKLGLEPGAGMEITEVFKETAADKAGLKPSDIILSMDDDVLKSTGDLRDVIIKHKVGDTVKLTVFRRDRKMKIDVKLMGEQTAQEKTEPAGKQEKAGEGTAWLGMAVSDITPELADRLGITDTDGVVIIKIEPDSAAADAYLAPGDIIREIEQQPVKSVRDFEAAGKRVKPGVDVLLLIERQGSTQYIVIRQDKE